MATPLSDSICGCGVANESCLAQSNAVLLILSEPQPACEEHVVGILQNLRKEFCGVVVDCTTLVPSIAELVSAVQGKTVFLCGNVRISIHEQHILEIVKSAARLFIVRGVSENYSDLSIPVVGIGRLPIRVHGVGLYYREFFEPSATTFTAVASQHAFQSLTESTKPSAAHRTGIYLTPVEQVEEERHFRLLRCSSNFSGPTANFGPADRAIVSSLNDEAAHMFANPAPLNHVLAQIYHNRVEYEDSPHDHSKIVKQTKAKIKAHADKTKDMPVNGLMAFVTLYDHLERLERFIDDPFNYGVKGISGLTVLHFRLKDKSGEEDIVQASAAVPLPRQFSLTLYPNSAFFMPLSTNRLYTHEIRPAALDATQLPVRMGYVVRCSNAEAVHAAGRTFLKVSGGQLSALQPPSEEGMAALRQKYAEENSSAKFIDYGPEPVPFSMNQGDYQQPLLVDEPEVCEAAAEQRPAFQTFVLNAPDLSFEHLSGCVQFQDVARGRRGAVLVQNDPQRGTPIVRTTTRYAIPAQHFSPAHADLARRIERMIGGADLASGFNNALIETYDNDYAKMGFHSDQAIDLADDSYIAVFSCYRDGERAMAAPPRKLVVEAKGSSPTASFEIPMEHQSVIVFHLNTNRRYRHKIVLEQAAANPENEWLGITFRVSKTFVQFTSSDGAVLEDGTSLVVADEAQQRDFYQMRARENAEIEFVYPPVAYTISASDTLHPV